MRHDQHGAKAIKTLNGKYKRRRNVRKGIAKLLETLEQLEWIRSQTQNPQVEQRLDKVLTDTKARLADVGTRLLDPNAAAEKLNSIKEDLRDQLQTIHLMATIGQGQSASEPEAEVSQKDELPQTEGPIGIEISFLFLF